MRKAFAMGFAFVVALGGAGVSLQAGEGAHCHVGSKADMDKKINKKVKQLTKTLNLTAEQQGQIRAVYQKQCEAMGTDKASHEAMHQDTVASVKSHLKPDQQAKYDKMVSEKNQNHKACCQLP
jgi:Spy/CpxP family protein refolding chaperone